ncbi:hypothetical protein FA95DRAFT_1679556 [Auriscalpium vulgare]|uniref:Uncharacterized protein n=1 Tax=Auriscalpium vulgare TaxID=40419 RepID=A0ACB8RT09_9AGAM|nr:hypothetical protein FA95DRAFT_1679556 [Auriscalpium vulgare]
MSRTAHLDMHVDFSEIYPSAFSVDAPLLHTLKVTIIGVDPLPDDFLACYAPALRELDYTTFRVTLLAPLTLLIFARLTSLHILTAYNSKDEPFHELLDGLLNGLEGMHELERLDVHFADQNKGNIEAEEPVQEHRRVTLRKLAYLELMASLQEVTMIISSLSLPAHAVARYTLELSTYSLPDRFFPLILASVHCHADPAADSSNSITSLDIGLASVKAARTDAHTDEPTVIVLFLGDRQWPARAALNALASVHLRELSLDCNLFKPGPWPDMLALRRLEVHGSMASLCQNLQSVPPSVPALAVLELVFVEIPAEGSGGTEGEAAWLLPRILAARAEAGCRLEELDVMKCAVDGTWVVHAQTMLPGTRVLWDEDAREKYREEWAEADDE